MPGLQRRFIRAAVVLLGVLLVLAIGAEIVMRLAWGPPVDTLAARRGPPGFRYEDDREIGWIFPAQSQGTFQRGALTCDVETNRWGLRGPEIDLSDSTAIRILVLGDSYAFGWCVPESMAFPRQLEQMLRQQHPELVIDVINGSIPGYGIYQQRVLLERILADVRIDIVISTLSLASDVVDELRIRRYAPDDLLDYHPAILDPRTRAAALIRQSRLLSRLRDRTAPLRFHLSNVRPKGVQLVGESVEGLVTRCRQSNAELLLVVLPRRSQIAAGELLSRAGRLMTWQTRRRYQEVASEHDVPVLDATPVLREAGATEAVHLVGDVHWNARGHSIVAEAIRQAIPAEWWTARGPAGDSGTRAGQPAEVAP